MRVCKTDSSYSTYYAIQSFESENVCMSFRERMETILAFFDAQNLDDEYQRRMAFFSLYDFFQTLIIRIGISHCGLPESVLKVCPVKKRWEFVMNPLSEVVKIPSEWTPTIITMYKTRNRIIHNEDVFPTEQMLEPIREQAPKFMEWIIEAGGIYSSQSKGFNFAQRFKLLSRMYIKRTDSILDQYGEKTPYSVKVDLASVDPYKKMRTAKDAIESRMNAITSIKELTKDDLEMLVELVRETERMDAREGVYLKFETCPKCGSQIVESQRSIGGCLDGSIPYAIARRVGCEKCDYEVVSDTIEI